MTTPTVPNVNVENLNSQIDNPTGAAPTWGMICSIGHKRLKANKPPFSNRRPFSHGITMPWPTMFRKSKDKSSAWKIASKISSSRK